MNFASLSVIRSLSSSVLVSRKSIINAISTRYYSSTDGLKTSSNGKNKLNSKCSTEHDGNSSNPSPPVNGSGKESGGNDDDDDDMEEMFIVGPGPNNDIEWGGPTRGGVRPEPTRYGDWERKGRATDFQ